MVLNVRALEIKDIPLIADYWLTSTPDFLKGMGVDLSKVPPRESLSLMLTEQLALPIQKRASYALLWECNGAAIGHSNVNTIAYSQQTNHALTSMDKTLSKTWYWNTISEKIYTLLF